MYRKPTKEIRFIRMMEKEKKFRKWYYKREFVYSFKRKIKFKRIKEKTVRYLAPRILKHYFIILKLKQLKRYEIKARKKCDEFTSAFLSLVECRLFMLVFRLH